MPDMTIEDGLRAAFRSEGEGLGFTITAAELERRLVVRRQGRTGRKVQLLAAAIAIVAIAGIATVSNGWLRVPAIGTTVTPAPSTTAAPPTSGLQPISATPGRIEVTRIDPTDPADPIDRTFQGVIEDEYVALHATVSCLGDGTLDFDLDGQHQHVDCDSEGETTVGGTYQAADDVLDYRLVTTGRISYGLLVDLQVASEPLPSYPAEPDAFTAPEMQVSVATLGVPGETLLLTTGCYSYELADGQTGTTRCPIDPGRIACCETLDVPWGADLTFTIPDGWSIDTSQIDSKGMAWVDDRSAPSRTTLGWSSLGDEVITFEGTFSKDGDTFRATYAVPIHGPAEAPTVPPPTTACGTPDLTSKTPPVVELVRHVTGRGAAPSPVAGQFGTTAWHGTFSDAAGDPMPTTAVRVAADAPLELRVAGDVCATGWTVGYGPRGTGDYSSIDQVGSLVLPHMRRPTDPPALANQFDLAPLPVGDWYIEAVFHYADGDAWVGWHVIVE
jgi:hypothetical protein